MQRHELPTHLDIEDKLFAGLTPRQLLLLMLGLGLSYSLWQRLHLLLPVPLVVVIALLPGMASLAFAALRPDGRPLEQWLLIRLRYHRMPKLCLPGTSSSVTEGIDHPSASLADEAEWQALWQALQVSPPPATDEWENDEMPADQVREGAQPLVPPSGQQVSGQIGR